MRRPEPVERESQFGIEEMFYSRTDEHGIIQSGNGVFVRVSGYALDQLLGRPHNVIRHPDMPRAVFKLLWERLKSGRPIGAYVKNMAVDGAYYWVFACVFPAQEGFVSIRIKPSSPFFAAAQTVYKELAKIERRESMDVAFEALGPMLANAGFATYDEFMTRALVAEIKAREASVLASGGGSYARVGAMNGQQNGSGRSLAAILGARFQEIQRSCDAAARVYADMFDRLDRFSAASRGFLEKGKVIMRTFNELSFLSMNMSLSAKKAGEKGRVLAVIAETFKQLSIEIQGLLRGFQDSSSILRGALTESEFDIAAARAQVDMIEFFVNEALASIGSGGATALDEASAGRLVQSCDELLQLAKRYSVGVDGKIGKINGVLLGFSGVRKKLEASMTGLEVIRQSGTLESSRFFEGQRAFEAHIDRMGRFIEKVKTPIGEMGGMVDVLSEGTEAFAKGLKEAMERFAEIERATFEVTQEIRSSGLSQTARRAPAARELARAS